MTLQVDYRPLEVGEFTAIVIQLTPILETALADGHSCAVLLLCEAARAHRQEHDARLAGGPYSPRTIELTRLRYVSNGELTLLEGICRTARAEMQDLGYAVGAAWWAEVAAGVTGEVLSRAFPRDSETEQA